MTNITANREALSASLRFIADHARLDAHAVGTRRNGKFQYFKKEWPITDQVLAQHLAEAKPVSVYPLRGTKTRLAVLDGDDHSGEAMTPATLGCGQRLSAALKSRGIQHYAVRSGGGAGFHIIMLWRDNQEAADVRRLLVRTIQDCGFTEGTGGLAKGQVELVPKQDDASGGFGSLISLPFSRASAPVDFETGQVVPLESFEPPDWSSLQNGPIPKDRPEPAGTPDTKTETGTPDPALLSACGEALRHVDADDYATWVKVAMALKLEFDDAALELFDNWSANSEKYPGFDEIARKWDRLEPNGKIGVRSIFFMADEAGWVPSLKAKETRRKCSVIDRASPLKTARRFLEDLYTGPGGTTLAYYQGQFYRWSAGRYAAFENDALKQAAYHYLDGCNQADPKTGKSIPFNPKERDAVALIDALKALVLEGNDRSPPFWRSPNDVPANELISFPNGLLHVQSMVFREPTPAYFCTAALGFDYDPAPPEPARFLRFLDELWSDDPAVIDLVQEIFGYCLLPDNSQQKLFLFYGESRGGKGTLINALQDIVGDDNVTSMSMHDLGTTFGMQETIGKLLVIVPDARLGRADTARPVETLLSISGNDKIRIARKNIAAWVGRPVLKFIIVTNVLPQLKDESGAIARRFIPVWFTRSFAGAPDPDLGSKIAKERAGILHWAIQGWRRMKEKRGFTIPESSHDVLRQLEESSAHVLAFVRQRCVVDPAARASCGDVFDAYSLWAARQGIKYPLARPSFGRQLASAVPAMKRVQVRTGSDRPYEYVGIALLPDDNSTGQRPEDVI